MNERNVIGGFTAAVLAPFDYISKQKQVHSIIIVTIIN